MGVRISNTKSKKRTKFGLELEQGGKEILAHGNLACSRLSGGFYTLSASLRTQDLPTQVAIGRILAAIPAESSVARRRKPPERRLQPGLAAPRTAGATTPPNRLSNRSGFGGGMLPAGVAGQLCHRRLSNGRATLAFYWTS